MLEALGELLFKADKFKRMHPNIVGHHSLDRTDKQNVTRQFAQPILGVDYEVEFVGKRSWTSNLNIIGEVSDRQTNLVSLCWITVLDVREKEKVWMVKLHVDENVLTPLAKIYFFSNG